MFYKDILEVFEFLNIQIKSKLIVKENKFITTFNHRTNPTLRKTDLKN